MTAPREEQARPPVYRDVAEKQLTILREIGASPEVLVIAERIVSEAIDRPAPPGVPAWFHRCSDCGNEHWSRMPKEGEAHEGDCCCAECGYGL